MFLELSLFDMWFLLIITSGDYSIETTENITFEEIRRYICCPFVKEFNFTMERFCIAKKKFYCNANKKNGDTYVVTRIGELSP